MNRKVVVAEGIPASGPYSHGVWAGDLFYLSGQSPLNPATGKIVEGGIAEQTKQCFENLFTVLEAAGLAQADVIKVNVYLTDIKNFAVMNAVYEKIFEKLFPARTTVGVAFLPLGAEVEIEMIARRP